MIRNGDNVLTLISETGQPMGVFDTPTRTERVAYCRVTSVSYRERYEAMAHGLRPEFDVRLADVEEYQDEKWCSIEGQDFEILHTWLHPTDGSIHLTIARKGREP